MRLQAVHGAAQAFDPRLGEKLEATFDAWLDATADLRASACAVAWWLVTHAQGLGRNTTGWQQTVCAQQSTLDDTFRRAAWLFILRGPSKCIDTGGARRWLAAYPCCVVFG